MKANSHKLATLITLITASAGHQVHAGFDQWQISEVFSSADGSIQFIELFTTAADQQDLNGRTLSTSNATGQLQNSTQLTGNLSGTTAGRNVLIGTQAFATLTGLTPDYLINPGFLFTGGGSVNFANGVATLSYQATQIPLNGVQSINGSLVAGTATPTNFANGVSATVVAPVPASFDSVTSILNLPIVDVPTIGLANLSFDVNLQTIQFALRNDFYLYGAGIVAGDNAASLLPGNILSVPALPIGAELYAFKMSIVADNPITFGNLTDIVVTAATPTPEPEPEPEPEPQPSELQQSISRGQTQFAQLCSECHGPSGEGGFSQGVFGPPLGPSGFNTLELLRSKIDQTMPLNSPSDCRDTASSTCATDVANYILHVIQN